MQTKNSKKIEKNRGLTLLFAVLLSVLILAVGASVISVALKQFVLSSTGRESQYAFYAANTGVACAQYWDLKGYDNSGTRIEIFPEGDSSPGLPNSVHIECAGHDFKEDLEPVAGVTTFTVKFPVEDEGDSEVPPCANVTVKKERDTLTNEIKTNIKARGYNTCKTENPRRTERGLEINY